MALVYMAVIRVQDNASTQHFYITMLCETAAVLNHSQKPFDNCKVMNSFMYYTHLGHFGFLTYIYSTGWIYLTYSNIYNNRILYIDHVLKRLRDVISFLQIVLYSREQIMKITL